MADAPNDAQQNDAYYMTRAGRRLTQKQADRRRFMQGLLASGALAGFGLSVPLRAAAQATPAASPAGEAALSYGTNTEPNRATVIVIPSSAAISASPVAARSARSKQCRCTLPSSSAAIVASAARTLSG